MTKKTGVTAGFLGGTMAVVISILFFWQGMHWINWLDSYIQGLPPPYYTPIYQAIGITVFCIPALIGSILILVMWYVFGKQLSVVSHSGNWSKGQVFFTWLIWGASVPLLLSIMILVPDVASAIERRRLTPQNIRDATELVKGTAPWWIFSGLMGGLISAIYTAIRWPDELEE